MRICKKTYDEIIKFFKENYDTEQGGMLGSYDGEKIEYFFPDLQPNQKTRNCYEPNIRVLNKELEKWSDKKLFFCGMIHSHLEEVVSLSWSDKKYIETIVMGISKSTSLWFPIILYQNQDIKMVVYKIEKLPDNIVQYHLEDLYIEN